MERRRSIFYIEKPAENFREPLRLVLSHLKLDPLNAMSVAVLDLHAASLERVSQEVVQRDRQTHAVAWASRVVPSIH
jgi:hypothetical protein